MKSSIRSALMSGVHRNSNFITTISRSFMPDFHFDGLILGANEK
jgi:hypothetical protein